MIIASIWSGKELEVMSKVLVVKMEDTAQKAPGREPACAACGGTKFFSSEDGKNEYCCYCGTTRGVVCTMPLLVPPPTSDRPYYSA